MADILDKFKIPANYDVQKILQEDFKRCQGHHYLDHAAATLYSDSQIRRVVAELENTLLGNPHSRHTPSDTAAQIIEGVRQRILEHFNTTAQEYDVIFSAGATDAIKTVAQNFKWSSNPIILANEKETIHSIDGNTEKQNESEYSSSFHGAFVYLQDNHTSVLGIRESANHHGASIYAVARNKLNAVFSNNSESTKSDLNSINNDISNHVDFNNGCEIFCRSEGLHLFAYSAQCNFSGVKAPLEWIEKVQNGALSKLLEEKPINKNYTHMQGRKNRDLMNQQWFVLLDAGSFVSTCPLDMSKWKPDFVPISFYKIFGYPTGLGCLLVSHRASKTFSKNYHGGGTVLMTDSRSMVSIPRPVLHDKFEDGTLPFLNIIALRHGFDVLKKHTGGMKNIQQHVYQLARYVHHSLRSYRHASGRPVAELYTQEGPWDMITHGGMVNFNLLNAEGSYVGYSQVEKVASLYNIHLRTGCLCNPGACQMYLNISKEKLMQQFEAGHVCGDAHDLVDGYPTGSVRVSFGYMSSYEDADQLLKMIISCFVDGSLIIDTSWLTEEWILQEGERKAVENVGHLTRKQNGFVNDHNNINNCHTTVNNNGVISSNASPKISISTETTKSDEVEQIDTISMESEGKSCNESNRIELTDIVLYPVKSCGSVAVKDWKLVSEGLQYDRRWMVVNDAGVTLTQKRLPRMSLVQPSIDVRSNTLTLFFEGRRSVSIPLELNQPLSNVEDISMCGGRVCGDRVQGLDCGPEVGEWLSLVLEKPNLKLMRHINTRRGKGRHKNDNKNGGDLMEELSLANDSQYLVIHRPSIRRLLDDIRKNGSSDLDEEELLRRFRGNIILDGGKPYAEDLWKSIVVSGVEFQIQGGCRRCQMVCVVPDTGERTKEPMLTLAAVRGSSMMFGVHAKVLLKRDDVQAGDDPIIAVGDAVEVRS